MSEAQYNFKVDEKSYYLLDTINNYFIQKHKEIESDVSRYLETKIDKLIIDNFEGRHGGVFSGGMKTKDFYGSCELFVDEAIGKYYAQADLDEFKMFENMIKNTYNAFFDICDVLKDLNKFYCETKEPSAGDYGVLIPKFNETFLDNKQYLGVKNKIGFLINSYNNRSLELLKKMKEVGIDLSYIELPESRDVMDIVLDGGSNDITTFNEVLEIIKNAEDLDPIKFQGKLISESFQSISKVINDKVYGVAFKHIRLSDEDYVASDNIYSNLGKLNNMFFDKQKIISDTIESLGFNVVEKKGLFGSKINVGMKSLI